MFYNVCNKYRKFKKKLKYHIFLQKMYDFFPLLTESVVMSIKKDI